MSDGVSKNALPALDRGLHILNQIIRAGGAVRYSELRANLPGIQDSSLSRTLKALEAYGYISRDADIGYSITEQVRAWGSYLNNERPTLATLAQKEVDQLTSSADESAAVVILEGDHITTLHSKSMSGGISVLPPGGLLHFEPDHAAAIAVLSELPASERNAYLKGPLSKFPTKPAFRPHLDAMRQDSDCLIDRSQERPGVCRIARSFKHGAQIGAVFFCLTIEACLAKQATLESLLCGATDQLGQGA
ncbi:winged helix-turn-helix transcriptional regulator [Cerasicoccus maritimus]|uniref:winged helix-turn-helix transcriptional regulator n=1 Tax=Cerasicoccus maritimus TaxID=490089 RepID=UPI002852A335|nr:winged helix-turn-helix transcriptional regulator [Cerasicoccus maritimus]